MLTSAMIGATGSASSGVTSDSATTGDVRRRRYRAGGCREARKRIAKIWRWAASGVWG